MDAFTRLNDLARKPESLLGPGGLDAVNFATSPATIAGHAQAPTARSAFATLFQKQFDSTHSNAHLAKPTEQEAALRKWASTVVNKFFIGTMLKQMRESPFKTELFGVGKGGEGYQGMMDQQLAEHAGQNVAKTLVDSIVKSKSRHTGDAQQLFADPEQQKKFEEYKQNQDKRVKHDVATSFTA